MDIWIVVQFWVLETKLLNWKFSCAKEFIAIHKFCYFNDVDSRIPNEGVSDTFCKAFGQNPRIIQVEIICGT